MNVSGKVCIKVYKNIFWNYYNIWNESSADLAVIPKIWNIKEMILRYDVHFRNFCNDMAQIRKTLISVTTCKFKLWYTIVKQNEYDCLNWLNQNVNYQSSVILICSEKC